MEPSLPTPNIMRRLSKTAQARGKTILKNGLARVGLELRRLPSRGTSTTAGTSIRGELPPIFGDPFEALHFTRGGVAAAFHCPIAQVGLLNGLTFGQSGWNPFSKTATQIQMDNRITYESSILRKYYEIWQPTDAAEAIIGLPVSCSSLKGIPSYLYYFVPWRALSIDAVAQGVWEWYLSDFHEHGFPALRIDVHGFKNHGPVTAELGEAEMTRLKNVLPLLAANGYDRHHGAIAVWLLKRGDEIRFINRGGLHRTAVMDALGHETIPARFVEPAIVDIEDVDYWPQVCMGTWTRDEALRYFNHLFDFETKNWAREQGLDE